MMQFGLENDEIILVINIRQNRDMMLIPFIRENGFV